MNSVVSTDDIRALRRGRGLQATALVLACSGVFAASMALPTPADASKASEARERARGIADRIEERDAQISANRREARAAGLSEMTALASLQQATRDSRAAAARVRGAERGLAAARGRYQRALRALGERLDEIYRSPLTKPDAMGLLLGADNLEQFQRTASYLSAIGRADAEVSERVARFREEARRKRDTLLVAKRQLAREVNAIAAERAAYARAEAQAVAAVESLGAAQGRDRERLSRARSQAVPGTSYLGGPYSIPTYIVMCESGGNYRALNPSSGAGGAYQILPSTWRAYGGKGLPHLASKAEQDRIAALIWRDAGPGAWVCS